MINCLGSQHYMDNDFLPLNYINIATRGVLIIRLADIMAADMFIFTTYIGNQLSKTRMLSNLFHTDFNLCEPILLA